MLLSPRLDFAFDRQWAQKQITYPKAVFAKKPPNETIFTLQHV